MAFVQQAWSPCGVFMLLVKQLGPETGRWMADRRPVWEAKDLGILYRIVPNRDLDGGKR